MRKRVSTVAIKQLDPFGWSVTWPAEEPIIFPTGADAQRSVAQRDRKDVDENGFDLVITTIEWEPINAVGRAIVAVLTGQADKGKARRRS